jgi:hypothetical protein
VDARYGSLTLNQWSHSRLKPCSTNAHPVALTPLALLNLLLTPTYVEQAAAIAQQLSLLLDGVIVSTQITPKSDAILIAYQTAKFLLAYKNQKFNQNHPS